ncbi:hypothetical protein KYK29_05140 [Shinella daejeonensis]|uniref:phage tail protein n=1 Tax=Shinella daejeonensis TaxID=659017 RepID=UPI0020C81E5A|nr:phage tail protein [Shinella daejeonensis]MCP8894306.1 hypothetical protein [Shinella daejeonensis]
MAIFSGLSAIVGGLLGGTFLSGIGGAILKIAVGIGINLLAAAISGQDAPKPQEFGIQGSIRAGGDIPRSFPLGWTATAGSLVYANEWGTEGGTPNAYFTQVISISDLPINGLVAVWVNGVKVTLDGTADPEKGSPVLEYRVNGKDHLWVKFHDGTQTVADSFLTDRVSTTERPYGEDRIGYGVAYAICTARINDQLFTGFPEYRFEVNGAKLYDPSKDSTKPGGSGSQREGNPSTWGGDGDHLPAVQIYNLLRGIRYDGEWFYGLQGMSAARLPASNWVSRIKYCRAVVNGSPRYRSGGEIPVSARMADTVPNLLTACQGRLSEAGGTYTLLLGASDASVATITDGDILSTEEQSFSPFFGLAETINGISATYPSPAEGWNKKTAPPRYNAQFETEDGNRRLMADVSLDFVPYKVQVQRLTKSALAEARRARRHTFTLPPAFWPLEPGDFVTLTSARNGYSNKKFRVDGVVDKENLDVIVDITEVDPSDYDWNQSTDYRDEPDGRLIKNPPKPQTIADWFASAAAIDDSSGAGRRPAIRLSWDGDVDDVVAVQFQVRHQGIIIYRGRSDDVPAGSILISQGLLPDDDYQVRGRYIPASPRETTWGGWLPVHTLDLRLGTNDILDEAITELKLADRAVSSLKIQLEAITSDLVDNEAIIASKLAAGAVTIAKFATGLRPVEILSALPAAPHMAGRQVYLTTDGKLYRNTGSGWTAATAAADITGTLASAQIESLAASQITGQLTNSQIADLAAAKLTGQIVASQIADSAVTIGKFAAGIRPVEILSALPGAPHTAGRQVYLTGDGKLYRNTGSGWTAATAAADITGTLASAQIESLTASKVTGQLTNSQIADLAAAKLTGQIVASQIADSAVTIGKFAAGIRPVEILSALPASGNVEGRQVYLTTTKRTYTYRNGAFDDGVDASQIVGKLVAGQIAAAAIGATEIAAGAVTASKLFVGDWSNLIVDSSYTDLSGIAAGGSTLGTLAGNAAWGTDRLLRVTATANWGQAIFPVFPVVAGEQLYGAVNTRCVSGDGMRARMMIQWQDQDGAGIGNINIGTSQSTSVVELAGSVTAPPGAAYARLHLQATDADAGGIVYFGRPVVRRKATGELIVDGAVTADKLAAASVTTSKVAAGAITANEIAANAVTAAKVAAGAIEAAALAAGAVVADKIAAGAVTTAKLDALAVTADKLAANSVVAGKIAAAAVSATEIAARAITASKLAVGDFTNLIVDPDYADLSAISAGGGTVTTAAAGDPAWGTDRLLSVVATNDWGQALFPSFPVTPGEQIYGSIKARCYAPAGARARLAIQWWDRTGAAIASSGFGTTTSTSIVTLADTVTAPPDAAYGRIHLQATDVVGAAALFGRPLVRRKATGELIVDGAITADKIAAASVTTSKVAAGAITANEIAAGAVTAVKVAAGAIESAKIAAGAVVADKIAAGAVTTAKLDALAVTADKIAANSVVAGKIAAGAVTATELGAGSVTAVKIAAGAVTANKINVNNLAAINATLGNVDISSANIGTLTVGTSNIAEGAVTDVQSFYDNSSVSIAAGSNTLIASVTVTTEANQKVILESLCDLTLFSNPANTASLVIRRAGNDVGLAYSMKMWGVITPAPPDYVDPYQYDNVTLRAVDTPPAGTHVYQLRLIRGVTGTQTGSVDRRWLSALVCKR